MRGASACCRRHVAPRGESGCCDRQEALAPTSAVEAREGASHTRPLVLGLADVAPDDPVVTGAILRDEALDLEVEVLLTGSHECLRRPLGNAQDAEALGDSSAVIVTHPHEEQLLKQVQLAVAADDREFDRLRRGRSRHQSTPSCQTSWF